MLKTKKIKSKSDVKAAFKSIGTIKNKKDKTEVFFPAATAGKIFYHKGFDSASIAGSFGELFKDSILFATEPEILKDGHKVHGNLDSYKHYVNKFKTEDGEYFIRFTVAKIRNSKEASAVHSSSISEVSIYKKGADVMNTAKHRGQSESTFVDEKLASFLSSVKQKDVSQIVDENGEPMVVYHGTNAEFWEFDKKKAQDKRGRALGMGWGKGKFYFTISEAVAKSNGGRVVPAFLNVRNPVKAEDYEANIVSGEKRDESIEKQDKGLKSDGVDGIESLDLAGAVAVFEPNQIKSAMENAGTYDAGNADIRYSIAHECADGEILRLSSAALDGQLALDFGNDTIPVKGKEPAPAKDEIPRFLRKLEAGEFCHVERVLTEAKAKQSYRN